MSDTRRPAAGAGFGTRAIHAATSVPQVDQSPDAVPIYQAVTFAAEDAAQLGDILSDRQPGYAYARIDNPTSTALAQAMAELEGAEAGYCFASGMAALHATFVSQLSAGDHVVAARALYGSVAHLLDKVLSRFGVETTFVDASDLEQVEAAFRPATRLLHLETIANPTIVVTDLAALVERAHRRGITVSVDNTFASPYLCRPIELGADLVIEALTKWVGGHSDVLGGVVVGDRQRVSAVRDVQIDTGGGLAPMSAFLVLRGISTLHVRMERHSSNALALARRLEQADDVRAVYYPGLPSHPQFVVAQRQLRAGGGMLAFDVGDRRAAEALLDALTIPHSDGVTGQHSHHRRSPAFDYTSAAGQRRAGPGRDPRRPAARLCRAGRCRRPDRRLRAGAGRSSWGSCDPVRLTFTGPAGRATISTILYGPRRAAGQLNPLGRLGWLAWRTLTSVRFAVLQISVLATAGVIGTLLRQLPAFALHDPQAYAEQMADMHAVYDPLTVLGLSIGPGMVDLFERLGFFRVFSAPWFVLLLTLLVISIVVCTLDRTPALWRTARSVKVVQAAPFFDLRLSERARFVGIDAGAAEELIRVLRSRHFGVRGETAAPDREGGADGDAEDLGEAGVRHIYGDRNQYLKLATLFTHLGLILFLAGAAVTTGLRLRDGRLPGRGPDGAGAVGRYTRQPARQEHPLRSAHPAGRLVRRLPDRPRRLPERPRRSHARSSASTTRSKSTATSSTRTPSAPRPRSADPRPARAAWCGTGRCCWRASLAGRPQGFLTIPGSDIGLLVVLDKSVAGLPLLALTGITTFAQPDGGNIAFLRALGLGATSEPGTTAGYAVSWTAAAAYTGMVIKRDPGQGLIWLAYLA